MTLAVNFAIERALQDRGVSVSNRWFVTMNVDIALLRKHGTSLRKIADEVDCVLNIFRSHLKSDAKLRYWRNRIGAVSKIYSALHE